MASPTWAEVWAQIGKRTLWLQELLEVSSIDAQNLVGIEDALQVLLEGEYVADAMTRLQRDRAAISQLLSPDNVLQSYAPFVLELMRVIGRPEREVREAWEQLRIYMNANAFSVQQRNLTLSSPVAGGSNVGTGTIFRVTVDRFAEPLESVFLETVTAKIIGDQGNGRSKHNELFSVTGEEAERDFLTLKGSGLSTELEAVGPRQTAQLVANASFDNHDATVDNTSPTTLNDWTFDVGSVANVKMRSLSSYIFQEDPAVTTPWALEFTGNAKISQTFRKVLNPSFDPARPYFPVLPVLRKASATGTVTLTLGSKSVNVSLATLTNDVWSLLVFPNSSSVWYDNFKQNDLKLSIEVTTLAIGTVAVDSLGFAPMQFVDGTFLMAFGGATPWARDDVFTWSSALVGAEAKNQFWFFRAGLPALPSSGTPTIADP